MQVMEMKIRALNCTLSLAQYEYVERRLSYALDTSVENISAVEVWLFEIHDTNDARNKRCLVEVTLSNAAQVVIDCIEADLYVAVHRAADQASWKVGRRKLRASARPHSNRAAAYSVSELMPQQSIR